MRPATIHFVITPHSAICHGGHAYSMSTMAQTLYGISCTFVGSSVLTNTEHTKPTRHLLERMLVYYHDLLVIPADLTSVQHLPAFFSAIDRCEGFLDLVFLCVLGEFGEILSPHSYSQPLDMQEQIFSMYARGCARNLVAWLHVHMQIDTSDYSCTAKGATVRAGDIFWDIMEHHTRIMIQYKRWAQRNDLFSDDQACTATAFESRMQECFSGNAPFHYSDMRTQQTEVECPSTCDWNLAWPPCPEYKLVDYNPNSTVDLRICKRKCSLTLNDQFLLLHYHRFSDYQMHCGTWCFPQAC
jgi:hypothetical protein